MESNNYLFQIIVYGKFMNEKKVNVFLGSYQLTKGHFLITPNNDGFIIMQAIISNYCILFYI